MQSEHPGSAAILSARSARWLWFMVFRNFHSARRLLQVLFYRRTTGDIKRGAPKGSKQRPETVEADSAKYLLEHETGAPQNGRGNIFPSTGVTAITVMESSDCSHQHPQNRCAR